MKPETRKKVKDVIERLDYRPNAVARGLASKKTTTVGVIIPDISNLYYSSLARGLDDMSASRLMLDKGKGHRRSIATPSP